MPSKTLKRILRGGLAGGRGYLRGKIGAAQEEEEGRQERNKALVDWLTTESQIKTGKARQAYYERGNQPKPPEPPKPMKESDVLGELLRKAVETGDWSDYERAKSVGKIPKEPKRPANITGIPDYESLVSGRQKITDEGRAKAAKIIADVFPDIFEETESGMSIPLLNLQKPEELAATARGSVPATIEQDRPGWFTGSDTVPNPELAAIDSILSKIAIPQKYRQPSGAGATALADSIEAARTDPTVAAALMDFMPQAGGQKALSPVRMPAAEAKTFHGSRTFKDAKDGIENLYRQNQITKAQRDQGIMDAKAFFGVE